MPRSILIALMAVLAGCASSHDQPRVGLANPASVYCLEQGGQVRLENWPGGQVGICVLPSGEEIEEWALYRRDHPAAQ